MSQLAWFGTIYSGVGLCLPNWPVRNESSVQCVLLMLFQTLMTDFIPKNTQGEILKNVHAASYSESGSEQNQRLSSSEKKSIKKKKVTEKSSLNTLLNSSFKIPLQKETYKGM